MISSSQHPPRWRCSPLALSRTQAGLSQLVGTNLKHVVLFLGSCFSLERYLVHSCDRTNGRILYPTLGVVCRLRGSTLESVRRDVQAFTAGKGFRKAADLAKPLP